MMKKLKKTIVYFLLVVVIANLPIPYFNGFLNMTLDQGHYRYSNADGSFTFLILLGTGRDFGMMTRNFEHCNELKPNMKDKTLYRLFWRNPLAFWRYYSYLTDDIYDLPYKNWKEIEELRNKHSQKQICFQSF